MPDGPVGGGRRCRKHLLFENRKLCYSAWSDNTKEPQLRAASDRLPEETKFFIWIRCNPLKSPESAKGIQGNTSNFICISLLFAWRMRSKSGKIGGLIGRRWRRPSSGPPGGGPSRERLLLGTSTLRRADVRSSSDNAVDRSSL